MGTSAVPAEAAAALWGAPRWQPLNPKALKAKTLKARMLKAKLPALVSKVSRTRVEEFIA
jgi:hypothetical protein